jgi:endoglucanase
MTGAATATAYMVKPDVIGLRFETGSIVTEGRTVPYMPLPGDRTGDDRLVTRDGEPLGIATATPAGTPMLQTLDQFATSPSDAFFLGTSSDLLGVRLPFLDTAPAADSVTSYAVEVPDGDPIEIEAVWRKSKIIDTARVEPSENQLVVQHDVFLELAQPLEAGRSYEVTFADAALPPLAVTYDTAALRSEAVHVSHIGFRPDDPVKVGYLSMWLGHRPDLPTADPAVDYEPGTAFRLLDAETGEVVFAGSATLDEARQEPSNLKINYNSTNVLALDFSTFDQPGKYVIEVEGVGTSFPFQLGNDVWLDAFSTAMQGFYHQRSGAALDEALTEWARPRALHPDDGITVYRSGATLMDTDQGLNLLAQKSFDALTAAATGETVGEAWGGWHDAGDWDRRIQHMEAARDLLDLAELRPGFAAATTLAVPESANDIPDLIDEALWGIDFYQRLQLPDGGVPGGIEAGAYPPRGDTSWTASQDFYVYAPDAWSSYLYAGVAARAALLLENDAPARAAGYAESALRAMNWAEANTPDHAAGVVEVVNARNLAAAELFRLTGDEEWHGVFEATSSYAGFGDVAHDAHQFDSTFVYARTGWTVDEAILERGIDALTGHADFLVDTGDRGGFGQVMNPWTPYGWSYTSAVPVEGDVLIKAHALTGEERYFAALIGETQFGLGANPDNMTFTTGLGQRAPREVLLGDKFGMGDTPDGITVFGGWNVGDRGQHWSFEEAAKHITPQFPDAWPVHETFIGYFWSVPITEYTIHGVLGRVAKAWGYIAASDPAGARAEHAGEQQPMRQRGDTADDMAGQQEAGAASPEPPTGTGGVLMPLVVPEDEILLRSDPAAVEPTESRPLRLTGALPPSASSQGNALDVSGEGVMIRTGDVLDGASTAPVENDDRQQGRSLASVCSLEQLSADGSLSQAGWGTPLLSDGDSLLPPLALDPTV